LHDTYSQADPYYQYDGLGSTREITNGSETTTDTYLYRGFGEQLVVSGTTHNSFRYVGEHGYYHDAETGNAYIRWRIYSPSIGRFTSTDPVGFVDGPNQYVVVLNDPINSIDPSGLVLAAVDGTGSAAHLATATPTSTLLWRSHTRNCYESYLDGPKEYFDGR